MMLGTGQDTAGVWRTRRLPAAAALLSLLVFALSANTLPAALLRAASEFGITPECLAMVAAVQFAGFVVAAMVGGMLSDRFGKQRIMEAACGLTALGAMMWAGAARLQTAVWSAALLGIGGGVLESMASSLVSDLFPERRKFMLNISQIMYCIGAVTGPVLMGHLLPMGVSWRWFFLGVGVLSVGLGLLYMVCRMPPVRGDEHVRMDVLRRLARRPSFMLPAVCLFLYVLSESAVAVYANLYLRTVRGAPEAWAIYSLSGFWIAMGIGRLLCARIPEGVSYRKVIGALCVATAVGLCAQAVARDWRVSFALVMLAGLTFSGIWPLIVGMTATVNRGYSGTVIGATIAIGALGCVAAPPMMNALFAWLPGPVAMAAAAAPIFLAGVLMAWGRWESR